MESFYNQLLDNLSTENLDSLLVSFAKSIIRADLPDREVTIDGVKYSLAKRNPVLFDGEQTIIIISFQSVKS